MKTAEYLGRTFELTSKQIKQIQNLALVTELDIDEVSSIGGVSQINVKGFKPQSFTVSYKANVGIGVNPLKEYRAWKKLLGKSDNFYLGETTFGIDEFVLKSVSLNDGIVNAKGDIIDADITLQLTQDIIASESKGKGKYKYLKQ